MKKFLAVLLTIATLVGLFSVSFSVSADVGDHKFYEQESNDYARYADKIYNDYTVYGEISGLDIDWYTFTVYSRCEISIVMITDYSTAMIGLADANESFFALDEVSYSNGDWFAELYVTVNPGTYYICLVDDYDALDNSYIFHIEFIGEDIRWGSWKQSGGRWWFAYEEGGYATGWEKIDDVWYYFDANGWMQTGWRLLGGEWYYFKSSGAMAIGWQQIGGIWYYFNADGDMATGWALIGGKWYYFNTSGAMVTGWALIGGTWYYFKSSGAMVTGWQQIGGTWYYLKSSGAMATGWQQIGSTWYYFKSSGGMVTGTQVIGGKTYTFAASGAWIA